MNEIWDAKRKELEDAVLRTTLDLFEHMHGAAAFLIEVPGTTPPVYVVAGDVKNIRSMLPN